MGKREKMLNVGDPIPDVPVWIKPHESHALADLAGGPGAARRVVPLRLERHLNV
jgi:hypothetical protein